MDGLWFAYVYDRKTKVVLQSEYIKLLATNGVQS